MRSLDLTLRMEELVYHEIHRHVIARILDDLATKWYSLCGLGAGHPTYITNVAFSKRHGLAVAMAVDDILNPGERIEHIQ